MVVQDDFAAGLQAELGPEGVQEQRAEPVPALLGDPPRGCVPPPHATACEPGWDAGLGPAATFTVEGEGDFAVALATFAMTPRRNASAPLGARVVRLRVR